MDPVIGLSIGRIVLGATAVARPQMVAELTRLDGSANPQLPYMTRLFGSREIALGAVTLLARGKARRRLVLVGMAVDGADTYAGVTAYQDGSLDKNAAGTVTAPAVLAVLTGVVSLVCARRKRKAAKRAAKALDAARAAA